MPARPYPWVPSRRGIPTAAQVLEQQRRDHAPGGIARRDAIAASGARESKGGTTRPGGADNMSNIAITNGFGGANSGARALQGSGLKFKDNEWTSGGIVLPKLLVAFSTTTCLQRWVDSKPIEILKKPGEDLADANALNSKIAQASGR